VAGRAGRAGRAEQVGPTSRSGQHRKAVALREDYGEHPGNREARRVWGEDIQREEASRHTTPRYGSSKAEDSTPGQRAARRRWRSRMFHVKRDGGTERLRRKPEPGRPSFGDALVEERVDRKRRGRSRKTRPHGSGLLGARPVGQVFRAGQRIVDMKEGAVLRAPDPETLEPRWVRRPTRGELAAGGSGACERTLPEGPDGRPPTEGRCLKAGHGRLYRMKPGWM